MPAKTSPTINLLGEGDLEHSPWGRILTWATTYGRYIMITTEIVVLLAFISRFSLDRKLTDLNEEIAQKQAIIQANADLEKSVRMLQTKLSTIRILIITGSSPVTVLGDISGSLPPDVYLNSLEISQTAAKMTVNAGTTAGISTFLATLQSNGRFTDIELGDISAYQTQGAQFDLSLKIRESLAKGNL